MERHRGQIIKKEGNQERPSKDTRNVSLGCLFNFVHPHYKNDQSNLLTGGLKMKKNTISRKVVILIMSLSMIFVPLASSLSMAQGGTTGAAGTQAAASGAAGAGATAGMSTAAIVGIAAAVVAAGVVAAVAASDNAAPAHHHH
jgi:hypothetical protein